MESRKSPEVVSQGLQWLAISPLNVRNLFVYGPENSAK
jgi:hypothetical protein